MADAGAICEGALRPTMRFVPVKSEESQAAAMVLRIRELLIRQRRQAINALRGPVRVRADRAPGNGQRRAWLQSWKIRRRICLPMPHPC